MPRHKKRFLRKEDTVYVLSGRDRGKRGRILSLLTKEDRVIVEKVNMVKRHTKPSQKNPQGGIVEKESPIHISNVMLVCNKCNQPMRVGRKRLEEGGGGRVCSRCGEIVDR